MMQTPVYRPAAARCPQRLVWACAFLAMLLPLNSQNIFQRPKEWKALNAGASNDRFTVSLTNYGGPFDGCSAEAAADGSCRMYGVSVGGCGFRNIPTTSWPYLKAVAFDPECPQIKEVPSFSCGACYRFTCVGGTPGCKAENTSVVALVTDICPGCIAKFNRPYGSCHADIHYSTFEELAWVGPDGGGYVENVFVERVSCKAEDNIHIRIKDNDGPVLWLRMLVWEAGGDGIIKTVKQKCRDDWGNTGEVTLNNQWGGTFETPNQPAGSKCKFELTDNSGMVITTDEIDMNMYRGRGLDFDIRTSFQFAAPKDKVKAAKAAKSKGKDKGGEKVYATRAVTEEECTDNPPPDAYGNVWYTCEQQRDWGKCPEGWMAGWCNRTCGRCGNTATG